MHTYIPVTQSDIERRAYAKFVKRNAEAGYVVHGFDLADYEAAIAESTYILTNRYEEAELRLSRLPFMNWSWWDSLRWNQLVIRVLMNDYFPLLHNDDMPGYGDRVCPNHMLDLLIHRGPMIFRYRSLTEEEYDELLSYRSMVADVMKYASSDLADRRAEAAMALYGRNKHPIYDIDYIWFGKPYEVEQVHPILPKIRVPNDHLNRRLPEPGDTVEVMIDKCSSRKPDGYKLVEKGDRLIVSRISHIDHEYYVYYVRYAYCRNYGDEDRILMSAVNGVGFIIKTPENQSQFLPSIDDGYRPHGWGQNAYGNVVGLDRRYAYRGLRLTPRYVADVIALRYLDLISAQQGKALIQRAWGEFAGGELDVFHFVREMKVFDEIEGNLCDIIDSVLISELQAVEDYKGGKKAAFGRLMGAVMKASKGRANAQEIKLLLEKRLC